jgi:hypothetical protein
MKTDELIAMLAKEPPSVDHDVRRLRIAAVFALGAIGSFLAMIYWQPINPQLFSLAESMWFWVRFTFLVSSAALAWFLLVRLGKPGFALRAKWWYSAIPIVVLAAIGSVLLMRAPPDERMPMMLGISWDVCSRNIAVLSIPILLASIWIARQFAPVRLRLTGAVLGFFAGSLGAFIYSMHCPELSPSFLMIWYVLGMLIPTALGAALGKRLLSW